MFVDTAFINGNPESVIPVAWINYLSFQLCETVGVKALGGALTGKLNLVSGYALSPLDISHWPSLGLEVDQPHLDYSPRVSLECKGVCSEPHDSTGWLSFCRLSDSVTPFNATVSQWFLDRRQLLHHLISCIVCNWTALLAFLPLFQVVDKSMSFREISSVVFFFVKVSVELSCVMSLAKQNVSLVHMFW